jgi:type IV pilus assembly protein PilV
MKTTPALQNQSGVMLLEALIAILIFAIGILGIVGLQGTAVKQVTDARFRSDAALLANQLIGQMWLTDRLSTTLNDQFTAAGASNAKYTAWKTMVTSTLPVPTSQSPTVVVNHTAGASGEGTVTITIFWLAPSEPSGTTPHQYVALAQIK